MKLAERSQQDAPTESPETRGARLALSHWIGEAHEKIRKILISDQALMNRAENKIAAKIFAAWYTGRPIGDVTKMGAKLDQISREMSEDDKARVIDLYERMIVYRDRLAEALGGRHDGESWATCCERVSRRCAMRQTAAIMAHLRLHRASPPLPVGESKRRPMDKDGMAERERQAEAIAAGMVGGRA